MALGEYEERVLAEMEKQLGEADPGLVERVSRSMNPEPEAIRKPVAPSVPAQVFSPRNLALGVVLTVVGLAVIVAGVSLGFSIGSIVLGVLGFCMMVAGVIVGARKKPIAGEAASWRGSSHGTGDVGRPGADGSQSGSKAKGATFMERQQNKWNERR